MTSCIRLGVTEAAIPIEHLHQRVQTLGRLTIEPIGIPLAGDAMVLGTPALPSFFANVFGTVRLTRRLRRITWLFRFVGGSAAFFSASFCSGKGFLLSTAFLISSRHCGFLKRGFLRACWRKLSIWSGSVFSSSGLFLNARIKFVQIALFLALCAEVTNPGAETIFVEKGSHWEVR